MFGTKQERPLKVLTLQMLGDVSIDQSVQSQTDILLMQKKDFPSKPQDNHTNLPVTFLNILRTKT